VDVSDPVNPRRVGGYPWGNVRSVTLQNDIAYLGDATGSMLILDVHEPANPRRIGCYTSLGQISNIAVSGRLAFVANLYFGLDVVDVGVEANPRRVGGYPVSSWTGALNVTSNRAFLVSAQGPYGSPSTLSVLDISNPSSPVRSGEYQYSLGTFQFVTSRSNLVFAANGYNWVEILDINIPTNIQSVGHYYLSGSAHAGPLALVGRYALVLDQSAYQLFPSDSLHVVDIANPGLPQKVGGWRASGVVVDIAIAGNMAYIPGGRKPETAPSVNTIYLIDISDPVHPREAGTYDTYGFPQGVSVVGTNLYVASVWDGLEIVDVSNPLNARRIGRCETQGYAQNVAVSGGYAYVGNSWAGLAVIDVSDPSNPRRVGGNSAVAVWNLGVAGDRILASTDRDGLQILNNFLTPIELSPRLDAGAVKLMLRGPAGQSIRVQRTSAPVGNWEDWQTLVVGSGGTELTDSLSPAVNQRFYRAVAP
jgi:hypothetical protein